MPSGDLIAQTLPGFRQKAGLPTVKTSEGYIGITGLMQEMQRAENEALVKEISGKNRFNPSYLAKRALLQFK